MGEVMASILSGLRPQTSTGCGAEPSGQVSRLAEADGLGLRLRVSAGLAPASPVQSGLRDPRTVHRAAALGQQGRAGPAGGPFRGPVLPSDRDATSSERAGNPPPPPPTRRHRGPAHRRLRQRPGHVRAVGVVGSGLAPAAPSDTAASTDPASPDPASPDAASATPSDTPAPPAEASPSSRRRTGRPTAPAPRRTGCSTAPWRRPSTGPSTAPSCRAGWFVEAGQYRLAAGGRLAIAYRGPGGARFSLDEGAWCTDGSGCVPAGTEIGHDGLRRPDRDAHRHRRRELRDHRRRGLPDQLGADRRRPRRGHRPHVRGGADRRRRLTERTPCASPTSSSSATSPAGSSRPGSSCAPRTSRATRWPTCWPSPTMRRGPSGRT